MSGERRPASFVVAGLLLLAGCAQPEEKVTRYKPFFTGLDGAKFGGPDGEGAPVNPNRGVADPGALGSGSSVIEHDDGTRTLVSKSVQQLIAHLERELDAEGNGQIVAEQLVSELTIERFRADGRPPALIVEFLRSIRPDLAKLFARMPLGEYSPQVVLHQPGDRTFEIEVSGKYADGLRFKRLFARLEGGNWKFVWVR